jgi:hypothetical protein
MSMLRLEGELRCSEATGSAEMHMGLEIPDTIPFKRNPNDLMEGFIALSFPEQEQTLIVVMYIL